MTKKLFIILMALVCTSMLMAQEITVVASNGTTHFYRTLALAIENATDNCVIYLPGGGFSLPDDVKITRKVTIIGVGHQGKRGKVIGVTNIGGNLYFEEGSNGSAVLGCYLTGTLNVNVCDFLLMYCNAGNINVIASSVGTTINQNFIRGDINFNGARGTVTNNILRHVYNMNGGAIRCNVFARDTNLSNVSNAFITDNVFVVWGSHSGSDIKASHNLFIGAEWGEDPLNLTDVTAADVFMKDNGVASTSNYHFQEDYSQYETLYGIYAGTSFNDLQAASVPALVVKKVDEQTNTSGQLKVQARIKSAK